ncbi:MAG: hypothetical protein AAB036_11475 [Elusimicrobiota bacterium]
MEASGLKQISTQLTVLTERVQVVAAKLEDLLFRAQRISAGLKNGRVNTDTGYGYDLQGFRGGLRIFKADISSLPTAMGNISRQANYDPGLVKLAQDVMRLASRFAQVMKSLHEIALLAHQHIRSADHKMAAWYIAQEIEEFALMAQSLPLAANKILITVSTPPHANVKNPP